MVHPDDLNRMSRHPKIKPQHLDRIIIDYLRQSTFIAEVFTPRIVDGLRYDYAIPTACPTIPDKDMRGPRGDGRYSIVAAAALLGRSRQTVYKWCRAGRVNAIRDYPGSPYWIALSPDDIERLQSPRQRQ